MGRLTRRTYARNSMQPWRETRSAAFLIMRSSVRCCGPRTSWWHERSSLKNTEFPDKRARLQRKWRASLGASLSSHMARVGDTLAMFIHHRLVAGHQMRLNASVILSEAGVRFANASGVEGLRTGRNTPTGFFRYTQAQALLRSG